MSTRILAGRYELLDRIGDGGMAVVYKARCRLLNRFVAIKILKPDFIKDVKFIENFRKESQAAASLSHPNIVNVYDVGREGNINYIVMELIEGMVLSDLIREEAPMDYVRAIEITKQIASALSLAHKNNIIHRDVKPHNILITQNGMAKITDFGIAKAVDTSTLVDNDGMIMGSVHYFSPEQARGGYVDEKSDIYSLGIVLYEMLTGSVPFDGDNPISVALMHVNDDMVPPSHLVSGIPPRLEQIVMKATDKIQINRYKSADEMLEALSTLEYVSGIVGDSAVGGIRRPTTFVQDSDRNLVEHLDDDYENDDEYEDFDDEPKKDKKGKFNFKANKIRLIAIALAIILGIPLSMGIASLLGGDRGPLPPPITDVEVPNIIGMTIEEALEELEYYGLSLRVRDEVISEEFSVGRIVSQQPEEGTVVREGMEVSVNISRGVREGTVPRIIGALEGDVAMILEQHGLLPGVRTSRSDNAPAGVVISQSPEPGMEITPGMTVNFVVSEGRVIQEGTVPALVGMSLDEATSALASEGLLLGYVTEEVNEEYEENTVVWQQFSSGHVLEQGSTVDLRITVREEEDYPGEDYPGDPGGENGEVEPGEPSTIPFTISYEAAENQIFFITITLTDVDGTRNVAGIVNQQRIRDDGSETVMLTGRGMGSVTVIFDGNVVVRRDVNFNTGVIY